MEMISAHLAELRTTWDAVQGAFQSGHLWLLILALFIACGFEFINGFHDTANAVATVIYTRSLSPAVAVGLSGLFNFLGVFLGGIAVAMGIIKLLPIELLVTHNLSVSMAMVFALLLGAIIWNLGTWYLGLPASSSHTMIGAILGIGFANAYASGASIADAVNWGKAGDIALALLISPAIGFSAAALLLWLSKKISSYSLHREPPKNGARPPWGVRSLLIVTSSGVSLAHGSNDGQKGVGLIMLILIAILPGHFALNPNIDAQSFLSAKKASAKLETLANKELRASTPEMIAARKKDLGIGKWVIADEVRPDIAQEDPRLSKVLLASSAIHQKLSAANTLEDLSVADRFDVRVHLLKLDQAAAKLDLIGGEVTRKTAWKDFQAERKKLKPLTDYAPTWVVVLVAISLGLGTMVGWKRVVVTVGEHIGKSHLTYAQGAAAQTVAMSTIGISALVGLPVSTTHILSSGIAGTMVAGRAGIQPKTVRSIALAWILTLPASMALSAGIFLALLKIIR